MENNTHVLINNSHGKVHQAADKKNTICGLNYYNSYGFGVPYNGRKSDITCKKCLNVLSKTQGR